MNTTERIRKQLQGAGIEHYRINESRKQSAELFYIKKDLDIVRSTDVADCTVTVYRDFESGGVKMRGSAAAMIYPDMTETEIGAAVRKAYDAALYVKNKFYELPVAEKRAGCGAAAEAYDLISEAFQMADALFSAEKDAPGSFLNSAEIFAERRASRVLSSTGIDISYVKYAFHGEFVTQCIADGQDIELHTSFSYRAPEYGQLAEKARAALKNARDRAAACAPPPAGRYAVILLGAQVGELLRYYMARTQGGMIYAGYSSFREGCFLQGDEADVKGEKLELLLKATEPCSAEGILMEDKVLSERGVLKTIHCGARYAYYLGIPATGEYSALECRNGSMSLEELKAGTGLPGGKVLSVAAFSDFQMDALSGQFCGEIRLAYLYETSEDGTSRVRFFTGGSISGNILEAQKTLAFSRERYKDHTYEGPYAVRLDGVSVAGV